MPWGGHPQGAPLPIVFFFRPRNRPPVAKDVENCDSALRSAQFQAMPWGGHPQGAHNCSKGLPRLLRYQLSSAIWAPTNCLLQALCPGEGTHKGRPYSRRYALRRAPTRGAPTRFRQPHVGLSQFDAIALLCTPNVGQMQPFVLTIPWESDKADLLINREQP